LIENFEKNRRIWATLSIMSFLASVLGIINRGIYDHVVSSDIMPGILAQDTMIMIASIVLFTLAVKARRENTALHIMALGLIGYIFYAYGIYVIEQLYTKLYFLYMALFGLSFYSIFYSLFNLDIKGEFKPNISRSIRLASISFLIITPAIFYPLWISQLFPLIQNADKLEFMYSIYILDICFIMPAFVIMAYKYIRKDSLGIALTPSLFIVGFTLLFPLSMTEALKPVVFDQTMDVAGMGLFLVLSVIYVGLAILNLRSIRDGL